MKLTNLILSNNEHTMVRILILTGIAWLPLFVLTLVNGTFISDDITIPFIKDVVPYVRGLIVIPLLVMADNVIEPMMARLISYLHNSGIVPDSENDRLKDAAEKMTRLMNSKWAQLLLVFMVIAISWYLRADYREMWHERDVTSWALQLKNGVVDESLAGSWFLLVTSPLVSFLLYRWVWRFLIWSVFLYRVSRMKLELYASHSDLAGGLGIFGGGQALFAIIFLIIATLLSSDIAGNILYEGDTLDDMKLVILTFIFISVFVITAPLLSFTKQLFNLKRKALAEYGELQQQISRDFHKHWIKDEENELVDSMQPSAMADYNVVYEVVSKMRIVPINPILIIVMAAVLLVPFLPLSLTESSIIEILTMIGNSLL